MEEIDKIVNWDNVEALLLEDQINDRVSFKKSLGLFDKLMKSCYNKDEYSSRSF